MKSGIPSILVIHLFYFSPFEQVEGENLRRMSVLKFRGTLRNFLTDVLSFLWISVFSALEMEGLIVIGGKKRGLMKVI